MISAEVVLSLSSPSAMLSGVAKAPILANVVSEIAGIGDTPAIMKARSAVFCTSPVPIQGQESSLRTHGDIDKAVSWQFLDIALSYWTRHALRG